MVGYKIKQTPINFALANDLSIGMKNKMKSIILVSGIVLSNAHQLFSQGFTSTDYKKALWMTTRMYGGQRSGANNWLLNNHLPSGVNASLRGTAFIGDKDTDGYDLSGGWHDCGDHVKFGHTMFYSAYILLKAYAEFPTGYDDYYTYDYKGYANSGDWTWEGKKHDPNGIPDILDEVKHATDYFIKCARNTTTFYFQVGTGGGNADHATWVTATKMQTQAVNQGGQQRVVYKNPKDASMPSFCGATLALMARLYKKYDPAYAAQCQAAALNAYAYAKANPGVAGTGAGGFYDPNNNWKDDYASMCAELFWATGNQAYKTEALSFSISAAGGQGTDIFFNYSFDYSNNGDIAIYNMVQLGKSNALTVFNTLVNNNYLTKTQSDGQYSGGNTEWGVLRYNGNSALIVALWQKLNNPTGVVNKFIYDNIDYILGKNATSQSFIVGFSAKSPKFPHHRNIYLRDDNPGDAAKKQMTIPIKNQQAGLMVGGTRNPSVFNDDVVDFKYTEPGIDYNAGLVGALGYINSRLAPVDTNKFGNPTPNLGDAQSICGLSSIVLDSKIPVDGKKTYTWLKDGNVVQAASTSAKTYTAMSAGKYTCKLDSAGKWSTQASVDILGVLNDVALGADKELCDPSAHTLDMGVTGSGIIYQWQKNGVIVKGATSKTYTVYNAGTYKATISASGCPSKSDEIIVTSKLPTVTNDTICKAGVANLAVSGTGGPFEWYSSTSSTSVLATGATYKPTITSNSTFYVKDASSIAVNAGPSSANNPLTGATNAGAIGIRFTASKAFTITQLKVLPIIYNCNSGDKVAVQMVLKQNGTTLATYTPTDVVCTGAQQTTFTTFYTLNFATPINIPAAGSYELVPAGSTSVIWFKGGANFITFDAAGVMDITDDSRDDEMLSFPGIFDIKIQAGSTCARTPVFAVIDAAHPCDVTGLEDENTTSSLMIYPNPSFEHFTVKTTSEMNMKVYDEMGRNVTEMNISNGSMFGSELPAGLYHVVFFDNGKVQKAFNVLKK